MASTWLGVTSAIKALGRRFESAASSARAEDESADSHGEVSPREGALRRPGRFSRPLILTISAGLASGALFDSITPSSKMEFSAPSISSDWTPHGVAPMPSPGARRALSFAVKLGETCRLGEPERLLESFQRFHDELLVLDKPLSNAEQETITCKS